MTMSTRPRDLRKSFTSQTRARSPAQGGGSPVHEFVDMPRTIQGQGLEARRSRAFVDNPCRECVLLGEHAPVDYSGNFSN
jgi:hypothetical protein